MTANETAPGGGSMTGTPAAPFGRMLTAMITPMTAGGAVDYDGAARLADYLVTEMHNDGLVISGTTDTAHTCELARQAERAGAAALLVVTPYYSKPPQNGLQAHFTRVADATGLPVMLYDIPGRTGTPIATPTLIRLAAHPRIVAVKDAKGDLGAGSEVMARTDLAFYCGDDILNLPWLAVGACGFVSVHGHIVGDRLAGMIDAYLGGDVTGALAIHRGLLPVYMGMTRTQNVITVKAALSMLALPGGPVRPPLADATDAEIHQLRTDLEAGGVKLR